MTQLGPKLIRATPPASESGEAEYWVSDVHPIEEGFGFFITDGNEDSEKQFLYPSAGEAEKARETMFGVLRNCVGVTSAT